MRGGFERHDAARSSCVPCLSCRASASLAYSAPFGAAHGIKTRSEPSRLGPAPGAEQFLQAAQDPSHHVVIALQFLDHGRKFPKLLGYDGERPPSSPV